MHKFYSSNNKSWTTSPSEKLAALSGVTSSTKLFNPNFILTREQELKNLDCQDLTSLGTPAVKSWHLWYLTFWNIILDAWYTFDIPPHVTMIVSKEFIVSKPKIPAEWKSDCCVPSVLISSAILLHWKPRHDQRFLAFKLVVIIPSWM